MPRSKHSPEHRDCFSVILHFHNEPDARAVLDAASLDDASLWKVTLRKCQE